MVWVTTGGDRGTVNRLTDILVTGNTPTDREKLFKITKLLYGLMLFRGSRAYGRSPRRLEYFIFSFTADFGEVMQDSIADEKEERPAQAEFLNPHQGEQERRFFMPPVLRSRAEKPGVHAALRRFVKRKGSLRSTKPSLYFRKGISAVRLMKRSGKTQGNVV